MGCCFSQPSGSNGPYQGNAPSSPSAGAINAVPPAHSTVVEEPRTRDTMRHGRRSRESLSKHIDRPLRRHVWISKDRLWTRAELDLQRNEFFYTRVTGRPEIWQVLHAALEILWEADIKRAAGLEIAHEDGTEGLATAQGMLSAAEVTLPTGDLANGAYDSLGNHYFLPEWVVSDPSNMAATADNERQAEGAEHDHHKGEDDLTGDESPGAGGVEEVDEDEEEDKAMRRREEKGKGVVDVKRLVKVRARLSDAYHDVVVHVAAEETVRSLAKKIADEAGLPPTKRVRLVYLGKFLQDNLTLQSQGWNRDHVVNALVFDR
ncbi:ubiquitin domain-containing protein [Xylariaceae sp. FL0594]|nr:ubiquitin domain-containing protein [Xylariaceae sp. FL0594]